MKSFDIPIKYRSNIVGRIKANFKISDPRKKELAPAELDFGPVTILLPRHFGFCYGVENAIEIAYKALAENPDKRIFLISQMIHNPAVNDDLIENGIRFLMDTNGEQLIDWNELSSDDVVITPAFGTTVEIQELLQSRGVNIETYNTTCPFVEKVWKRSSEIGSKGFSVIIHGKAKHEETRATFSHSYQNAPAVIIRNMNEARELAHFIKNGDNEKDFFKKFEGRYSEGFDPSKDLMKLGVVNQTTMLASETQEISDFFKSVMIELHGENYKSFFADTRDTLCYATNDNQDATRAVLNEKGDLAIVVGGYNSSNTAQIHSILKTTMPSYFIRDAENIKSFDEIVHFLYDEQMEVKGSWLRGIANPRIIVTSGASCPDRIVDEVMIKIISLFPSCKSVDLVLQTYFQKRNSSPQ